MKKKQYIFWTIVTLAAFFVMWKWNIIGTIVGVILSVLVFTYLLINMVMDPEFKLLCRRIFTTKDGFGLLGVIGGIASLGYLIGPHYATPGKTVIAIIFIVWLTLEVRKVHE